MITMQKIRIVLETKFLIVYLPLLVLTCILFFISFQLTVTYQVNSTSGSILPVGFFALSLLSYFFGIKHGLDADHIAAIDASTRKLIQQGSRSTYVGTFFSLGHSTVIILVTVLVIVTARTVPVSDVIHFQLYGSVIGLVVSISFLFIIGSTNILVLISLRRLFKRLGDSNYDRKTMDIALNQRGFLTKYFKGFFRIIEKDSQMYFIGFLFGIGFDTVSEIAIISLSALLSGTLRGTSILTLLIFPLLFTSGMVLVDSSDGFFMNKLYGWAGSNDVKKLWFNMTMTAVSVLVAYAIGGFEFLTLLEHYLNIGNASTSIIFGLNSGGDWSLLGLLVVLIFAVSWAVSAILFKTRYAKNN